MQKHNTESKIIEEIQEGKITENENRAHNNRIDTGTIRKAIHIYPFFALRDTKRYTDREIHTKEEKTSQRQKEWGNR